MAKIESDAVRPVAGHLFTVEEFIKLLQAEVLSADKKFELIEGEIFEMTAMEAPHFAAVMRLNHLFVEKLGKMGQVSVQSPIRLSAYSMPEPDLVILHPRSDFYAAELPKASDVLLIVEVSGTTLSRDKAVKRPLYANHNLVELWIVNLSELQLESLSRTKR
ncbi:MAG: Uma2 family endonuclease [Chloroherpetonaceae bacterium]|nr:Uma2 family endonuclease [Chloroherpetonaceae bacterium]